MILPDHLHAIFTLPPGDADFSGRWRRIKGLFTRKVGATEGRLWQRRFWEHTIRDDKDFVRHVDYIHWNPVKHGHVSRVGEWPYSSFHRYVRMGWLVEDWRGDVSDPGGAFGEPGG